MLIKIDDNLLINPDHISVVETKKVRGNEVVTIWIDGRSYTVSADFRKTLMLLDRNDKKQFFAG